MSGTAVVNPPVRRSSLSSNVALGIALVWLQGRKLFASRAAA